MCVFLLLSVLFVVAILGRKVYHLIHWKIQKKKMGLYFPYSQLKKPTTIKVKQLLCDLPQSQEVAEMGPISKSPASQTFARDLCPFHQHSKI